MKLDIEQLELDKETSIKIDGRQAWLDGLYTQFKGPKGSQAQLVEAEFHITRLEDYVLVHGQIDYTAHVNCSRCNELSPFPISEQLNLTFIPQGRQLPVEKDLSEDELDECFLKDNKLDLEQLISDTVILAIPQQFIPDDSSHNCAWEEYTASRNQSKPDSPFAALKNLKLN